MARFKEVVDDVSDIDLAKDFDELEKYIESLKKYASEAERHDQFSKARLFSEEEYSTQDQKNLLKLIDSVQNLIENQEFKKVIERHVSVTALKALVVELTNTFIEREQIKLKQKWINVLIKDVKAKLQLSSAATPLTTVDLYRLCLNKVRVEKFLDLVEAVRADRVIAEEVFHKFRITARTKKIGSATELKNLSGKKASFVEAYKAYGEPYDFIQALKRIEGLEVGNLHKYFSKIEYTIQNKDGFAVSGGERSEFNLLQEIEDSKSYDMLLIDEPESSFDNLFLNGEVNLILREISKKMPVVIVTHNSTVGASIKPDYLICTTKEREGSDVKYRVYSGYPADKKLSTPDGRETETYLKMLGCLEAGPTAYDERRKTYENLKD